MLALPLAAIGVPLALTASHMPHWSVRPWPLVCPAAESPEKVNSGWPCSTLMLPPDITGVQIARQPLELVHFGFDAGLPTSR